MYLLSLIGSFLSWKTRNYFVTNMPVRLFKEFICHYVLVCLVSVNLNYNIPSLDPVIQVSKI